MLLISILLTGISVYHSHLVTVMPKTSFSRYFTEIVLHKFWRSLLIILLIVYLPYLLIFKVVLRKASLSLGIICVLYALLVYLIGWLWYFLFVPHWTGKIQLLNLGLVTVAILGGVLPFLENAILKFLLKKPNALN